MFNVNPSGVFKPSTENNPQGKYRFAIGQKVFHPFYGVGTIVGKVEEKKSEDHKHQLSTIEFSNRKLQITTCIDKESMIKRLINHEEVRELLGIISNKDEKALSEYPIRGVKRYGFARDKMKQGDIHQLAEVIRDLTCLNDRKKITTKECELLASAKDVFCQAISETEEIEMDEARDMLKEAL